MGMLRRRTAGSKRVAYPPVRVCDLTADGFSASASHRARCYPRCARNAFFRRALRLPLGQSCATRSGSLRGKVHSVSTASATHLLLEASPWNLVAVHPPSRPDGATLQTHAPIVATPKAKNVLAGRRKLSVFPLRAKRIRCG